MNTDDLLNKIAWLRKKDGPKSTKKINNEIADFMWGQYIRTQALERALKESCICGKSYPRDVLAPDCPACSDHSLLGDWR